MSWVHGNHIIKFGGEYRRQNTDNFSYTPGTFSFPTITAFLADQANSFSVTNSNRSNRTYGNSIGAFVTDTWKLRPTFTVTLGLRYDWYGTPTEAENRFVVFNPATDSLNQVGQTGGPSRAYHQSALNFEPRVGIVWDPFKTGKNSDPQWLRDYDGSAYSGLGDEADSRAILRTLSRFLIRRLRDLS